jgi:hypothetical protein
MRFRVNVHLSQDRIADYLAGLLVAADEAELEEHLFSCRDCSIDAELHFGLTAAIRQAVPPVISPERFEALEGEGRITQVNSMSPGQLAEVRYPDAGKLLVHRLGGANLAGARRVDVELGDLEGRPLVRYDDIPFDAVRGEVFVACQRHYAGLFPQDILVRVEVVLGDRREETSRYTVLHRM